KVRPAAAQAACAVSSRLPGTRTRSAPYSEICAAFPAEVDAGTYIWVRMPAAAPYAATDAPALPDESSTISPTPHSFSLLSITVLPRSLYEPVGQRKSSLSRTRWEPRRN